MGEILQLHKVPLSVSESTATAMRYMALSEHPREACGIVYAHNIVVQYPNTFCGDKEHGYDMEVDLSVGDIKAIWHSHPHGPISPSEDDIPCMRLLVSHGYKFHYIIVTPKEVNEYEACLMETG